MIEISRLEARNFLLVKQGLIGPYQFRGKEGIMNFIDRTHMIQFDPVDLCGKNAQIVLHSRIEGFQKEMLDELLYTDSELMEAYDKKLCIVDRNDWVRLAPVRWRKISRLKEPEGCWDAQNEILDLLAHENTASVKSFTSHNRCKWYWGRDASVYQIAFERLFAEGSICISSRRGNTKQYRINELYSTMEYTLDDDYYKWHILRRIESVGLLRCDPSPVWDYIPECTLKRRRNVIDELIEQGEIEEVCVDTVDSHMYCSHKELQYFDVDCSNLQKRVEFLAPLDNLLWDRKLLSDIFSFDYIWEIYIPEAKRQFCSYCQPILWGNELVGRIELKVEGTCLTVRNIWIERPVDRIFLLSLKEKLIRFAHFNSCISVNDTCIDGCL